MQRVCRFDELIDNEGKGVEVELDGERVKVVVVRRGERVFAYRNVCPHRGTTLDWMPDRFMSEDGAYLQCATHGAQFEPETGLCVVGPCRGKSLQPVAVEMRGDEVVVSDHILSYRDR